MSRKVLSSGVSLAKDYNQKNTTASVGLSYQIDDIDPVGGLPIALSSMVIDTGQPIFNDEFNATRNGDSESKDTIDLLLGVTQVINRRILMQFNYSYSMASGYLTDPYKLLSVVDTGGLTQDIVHENRPDKRIRHSFFWQTKYAMGTTASSGVVDFSYRYSTDDWKINSHTFETRLRFNVSKLSYLQPHFRYYQQSEAEFFNPFLLDSAALPTFASADYRLGKMMTYTIGLKYGTQTKSGNELGYRLEYYQQNSSNAGFNEPGVLSILELYPSVTAVIAQVSYSF